jgi:phage-related protein
MLIFLLFICEKIYVHIFLYKQTQKCPLKNDEFKKERARERVKKNERNLLRG